MSESNLGEWGWDAEAQERFARYHALLVEWNERINLTAITDRAQVYIKHFYDSTWIRSLPEWQRLVKPGARVVDVGSGAGLPGLALAIVCPEAEFVLLDALHKRVVFLQTVVSQLGLTNVRVIHRRAEDAAREQGLREAFDIVVARAVARLNVLVEYTLPFAVIGGAVFAYKGPGVEEELSDGAFAARRLGGELSRTVHWQLPDAMGERTLIVVNKIVTTPKVYPRKAGTPQKQPLTVL